MQGLSLGTMLSNFFGVPHKSSLLAEASFYGFPARRIPTMQQVQFRLTSIAQKRSLMTGAKRTPYCSPKMAATATQSAEEEVVCDKAFTEELLEKLNEFRKDNTFCDVTLQIEGQNFSAHRCVLSAASPYFRSLFTSGFKENKDSTIVLQDTKPAVLSEALRFIYTGEALVNATSAQDLVKIADYFIVPRLKTKVSKYLEECIHSTNCLALESFADQFGCESLKQAASEFKLKNFISVVKSEDFKTLNIEKVKQLISHDEIIVSKEDDVYEAIVSWVKHDLMSRECLFSELLKCVRLFSLSKYSLLQMLKEELVLKSRTCLSVLHEGLEFFFSPDRFLGMSLKPRTCLSTVESAIILTGGHHSTVNNRNTYCFLPSKNHWLSLPEMPFPRTRHGAAVCCGQLYVIGGMVKEPACSYNPIQNKWTVIEANTSIRQHCSVVALNEELYVTGGDQYWNRVDKYSPILAEWKEVSSMKIGRGAHCAIILGNLIYVIGGMDSSICHNSIECFDPLTNHWSEGPSMNVARQFACAAVSCGNIFVAGGYSNKAFTATEASCEMFDPVQDQWSLVSSLSVPRAACAMVSFDNHLYLFGGEDGTEVKYDSVECYDVKNNKWEHCGTMPGKHACVQASLLLLPKKYINDLDTFDRQ